MTQAQGRDRIRQAAQAAGPQGPRRGGRARLLGAVLLTAAVFAGGTACSGSGGSDDAKGSGKGSTAAKAEVFGPKGYRGLGPGTTKDAAMGTGALQTASLSALTGCALFSYQDGPAPDPAVIAAETAATTKSKETREAADKAKTEADAKRPGAGASAQEYADDAKRSADVAKLMAASTGAIADELKLMATRDKAFETTGGAKFGTDGRLKQLIAPPKARTAEGIGAGSTEDELKKAYPKVAPIEGGYTLPVEGSSEWESVFVTEGGKVTAMSLFSNAVKCV
ncbi:hypothetical protein [Kitasatospora camelliae]|uniref:Lipoprotein n=1 Tax=Kitasatospora camelliae TaxID=3156397 RepID=A0AAU8JWR8_9ACTN